jgi:tight adherence protein C
MLSAGKENNGYQGVIMNLTAFILAIFAAFTCVIIVMLMLYRKRYRSFIAENGVYFKLNFMAPVSLGIIDQFHLMERMAVLLTATQHRLIRLFGKQNGSFYTKMFLAQIISAVIVLLYCLIMVAWISNGDALLMLCVGAIVLISPALIIQELDRQVKHKNRQIVLALPEFISKVTLLVNAGETIQNAMIRSIERIERSGIGLTHPLFAELLQVRKELSNHYPFAQVIDEWSKRCAVQEVSIFCSAILLNYRRGGNEFVQSLRDLSSMLWERRKMTAKTLGEEASAKLVFPMVLQFVAVMMVVAAPALMLMN